MVKRNRPESEKKTRKKLKKETQNSNTAEKGVVGTSTVRRDEAMQLNSDRQEQRQPQSRISSNMSSKKTTFLKKKIDIELSLLPGSLRNTDDAIQNSLNQLLMKYSDGLGGIMLAWENIQIKPDGKGNGQGWILNELPWIHYTVSCDALVFRPYIGCQLNGVVNECFPSHLGMLVLNYFNAMVSADQLRGSGYTFDADLQKWVSEESGQAVSTSSRITFDVEKVHECDGTLSLEGINPSLTLLVEA